MWQKPGLTGNSNSLLLTATSPKVWSMHRPQTCINHTLTEQLGIDVKLQSWYKIINIYISFKRSALGLWPAFIKSTVVGFPISMDMRYSM